MKSLKILTTALILTLLQTSITIAAEWSNGQSGNIYYDGGNIGIGTTEPKAPLDVSGTANIGTLELDRHTTGHDAFISNQHNPFIYSSHHYGTQYPFTNSDLGHLILQPRTSSARDIILATGYSTPTPNLVVKGNGNVGIGTTTPTEKLHVNVETPSRTYIGTYNNARISLDPWDINRENKAILEANSIGGMSMVVRENEALSILPNGRVGIGNTNPEYTLDINSTQGTKALRITGDYGTHGDISTKMHGNALAFDYTNYSYLDQNGIGGKIRIRTSKDSKVDTTVADFRADGNTVLWGNLGIGTTSPSEKIDIDGNIKLSGNIISDNDICIGKCD